MLKIRKVGDFELKRIIADNNGVLEGLFEMEDIVYRRAPGLSASLLKEFAISPASYKNALSAPRLPTPAMEFGTAAHMKLLEPERFEERYIQEPVYDGPRNKNPWAAEWKEFKKANEGKDILGRDLWATLEAMEKIIRGIEWTARIFREGWPEVSMFWLDPATGIQCKAKVDWINEDIGIVDYKTVGRDLGGSEASVTRDLNRIVGDYRYWLQQAHYQAGAEALSLDCNHSFTFVFQKTKGGFDAVPYFLSPYSSERAFVRRAALMQHFKECSERDSWPPLAHKGLMGELPEYFFE